MEEDAKQSNFPTDEQVDRLFRLTMEQLGEEGITGKAICKAILIALLNRDVILDYR